MNPVAISPNAYSLTRFGLMNCFLVRERGAAGDGDSFTLIDTTIGGAAPGILAAAETLGAPIRRILLTHAHLDHVGSVDALLKLLPAGTVLAASSRSLPLLEQPPNKSLQPSEPQSKVRGGLPGIASIPTHLIGPGELFGSLRAIDTPGHIPGHLSFLDERDGTLFAGDALIGVGTLSVTGFGPWYFPFPDLATWNKAVALTSAQRLLNFPIHRIACGHGRLHPADALRPALRKAATT